MPAPLFYKERFFMELKLNIYAKNDKGRYELEKTYMSEAVDIMFGTAEDLFGMLGDLDIKDNKELLNAVTKGFSRLNFYRCD